MSFPFNKPNALGNLPLLTEAAGAIIDQMGPEGFDWRSRLEDSSFLESADWLTAVRYARAALRAVGKARP